RVFGLVLQFVRAILGGARSFVHTLLGGRCRRLGRILGGPARALSRVLGVLASLLDVGLGVIAECQARSDSRDRQETSKRPHITLHFVDAAPQQRRQKIKLGGMSRRTVRTILTIACCVAPVFSEVKALKNFTLIDGNGGPAVANAAMLIDNGRITWIGSA